MGCAFTKPHDPLYQGKQKYLLRNKKVYFSLLALVKQDQSHSAVLYQMAWNILL